MADVTVDARKLQCPMPVLKLAQAMGGLTAGQTVELIATDRGALSDVPAWAKDMGHSIIDQSEGDGELHFVLQHS